MSATCSWNIGGSYTFLTVISAWIIFARAPPCRLASPESGGLEELAWGPVREPLLLCMFFSLLFSYLWDVWWRIRQVFPHDKREDPSSKCKTLNRPESVGQYVMSPNSSFKYNEFVSTWEIQFSSFAVFSVEDFTCNTAARWVTTVKYDLNFFLRLLNIALLQSSHRAICKTPNVTTMCTCLKYSRKPRNCHISRCYS